VLARIGQLASIQGLSEGFVANPEVSGHRFKTPPEYNTWQCSPVHY